MCISGPPASLLWQLNHPLLTVAVRTSMCGPSPRVIFRGRKLKRQYTVDGCCGTDSYVRRMVDAQLLEPKTQVSFLFFSLQMLCVHTYTPQMYTVRIGERMRQVRRFFFFPRLSAFLGGGHGQHLLKLALAGFFFVGKSPCSSWNRVRLSGSPRRLERCTVDPFQPRRQVFLIFVRRTAKLQNTGR